MSYNDSTLIYLPLREDIKKEQISIYYQLHGHKGTFIFYLTFDYELKVLKKLVLGFLTVKTGNSWEKGKHFFMVAGMGFFILQLKIFFTKMGNKRRIKHLKLV